MLNIISEEGNENWNTITRAIVGSSRVAKIKLLIISNDNKDAEQTTEICMSWAQVKENDTASLKTFGRF